jgi:hypothetical protein
MYGTFVNSMNEMKRIAYRKDHISHLDHLAEYKIRSAEMRAEKKRQREDYSYFYLV